MTLKQWRVMLDYIIKVPHAIWTLCSSLYSLQTHIERQSTKYLQKMMIPIIVLFWHFNACFTSFNSPINQCVSPRLLLSQVEKETKADLNSYNGIDKIIWLEYIGLFYATRRSRIQSIVTGQHWKEDERNTSRRCH